MAKLQSAGIGDLGLDSSQMARFGLNETPSNVLPKQFAERDITRLLDLRDQMAGLEQQGFQEDAADAERMMRANRLGIIGASGASALQAISGVNLESARRGRSRVQQIVDEILPDLAAKRRESLQAARLAPLKAEFESEEARVQNQFANDQAFADAINAVGGDLTREQQQRIGVLTQLANEDPSLLEDVLKRTGVFDEATAEAVADRISARREEDRQRAITNEDLALELQRERIKTERAKQAASADPFGDKTFRRNLEIKARDSFQNLKEQEITVSSLQKQRDELQRRMDDGEQVIDGEVGFMRIGEINKQLIAAQTELEVAKSQHQTTQQALKVYESNFGGPLFGTRPGAPGNEGGEAAPAVSFDHLGF